jgi:hypothetical protein
MGGAINPRYLDRWYWPTILREMAEFRVFRETAFAGTIDFQT